MCLAKVYKIPKGYDKNKVRVGWKLMHESLNGRIVWLWLHKLPNNKSALKKGTWYESGSERTRIMADDGVFYEPAFHIYTKEWRRGLIKVLYRKVVSAGLQVDKRVVVAREIFIPK